MTIRRFLVIAICAVISAFTLEYAFRQVRTIARIAQRNAASPASKIPAAARALRPNYPYSVIPGGAYSPAELRYAVQHDAVVRDHYAGFDLSAAHLVTLPSDRYQYVSFRVNGRVFWTRKRLRIPQGEVLLTDGIHYARTRCGNRLAAAAQTPTTLLQPPDHLLALPPFTPKLLSLGQVELAAAPPAGELAQAYPVLPFESPRLLPFVPASETGLPMPETATSPAGFMSPASIAPAGLPLGPHSPPATQLSPPVVSLVVPPPNEIPSEVPEPASLLLFGLGLCGAGWTLGRFVRRPRRIRL